ncbi:hypothetical protein [Ensifer sp. ENS03]|uniref:hypothetical protein n=1 Tax=Ensifer sp. ENS03 TaxID=2769283 RepID=UPI00177BB121|nr:hypothetical protein [Ensifer sp. ENS03]MBD9561078.1 hypothetical protein [Ensifer sp. ENS03]
MSKFVLESSGYFFHPLRRSSHKSAITEASPLTSPSGATYKREVVAKEDASVQLIGIGAIQELVLAKLEGGSWMSSPLRRFRMARNENGPRDRVYEMAPPGDFQSLARSQKIVENSSFA